MASRDPYTGQWTDADVEYPEALPEALPRALHFDLDRLRYLVWLRTFRTPLVVRTQGLLVIAEFEDQTIGVWRVEELEKNAQEMMP